MQCLHPQRVQAFRAVRHSSSRTAAVRVRCAAGAPKVVVTRESGKNGKLMKALSKHGIECIELPLIEHAPGPDRDQLPGLLQAGGFDWVACTSPESAAVFIEGWKAAGQPQLRVAVVGGGTGEVLAAAGVVPEFTASKCRVAVVGGSTGDILAAAGISPSYTPTKALGKVMGSELPHVPGGTDTVLYPASVKASTDLQDSLAAAGFKVQRINTYNTVGVTSVDQQVLQQALAADVVTFGSPSAVKSWIGLVGLEAAKQKTSVCIGSTSARACDAAGLERVHFPDSPSVDAWVECTVEALQQMGRLPAAAVA